MTNLICIICPKGCHMEADGETVRGAGCQRGWAYALKETTHPARVITSTVRLAGSIHPRLPVKTDRDIPKEKIFEAMALLDAVTVQAPVHTGDVVAAKICGTDANWVATRDM